MEVNALGDYPMSFIRPNSFPVFPPSDYAKINATKTLEGSEAATVLRMWFSLRSGNMYRNSCLHSPTYGLRFYKDDRLLFETSVCFSCSQFTVPLGGLGNTLYYFDGRDSSRRELFDHLQQLLPRPMSKRQ